METFFVSIGSASQLTPNRALTKKRSRQQCVRIEYKAVVLRLERGPEQIQLDCASAGLIAAATAIPYAITQNAGVSTCTEIPF